MVSRLKEPDLTELIDDLLSIMREQKICLANAMIETKGIKNNYDPPAFTAKISEVVLTKGRMSFHAKLIIDEASLSKL